MMFYWNRLYPERIYVRTEYGFYLLGYAGQDCIDKWANPETGKTGGLAVYPSKKWGWQTTGWLDVLEHPESIYELPGRFLHRKGFRRIGGIK